MPRPPNSWTLIASFLTKALSELPDVGVVHDVEDYPLIESELEEWLKEDPEKDDINAWVVSRDAIGVDRAQTPPQQWNKMHRFTIRGYISRSSDSYTRMQNLVDLILDVFSPPTRLDIEPGTSVIEDIPEAIFEYKRLGATQAQIHYIEIGLDISELMTQYTP